MKNKWWIPALVLICTLILLGLFVAVPQTYADIRINTKHQGFDVLLPREDICALALHGDTLFAGGANGLFEVDMATLQAQKIGDYTFVRALLWTQDGLWVGHETA
jgi:hypothetical protein